MQHQLPEEEPIQSPSTWFYVRTMWKRYLGLNISPITPLLSVGGQFRPNQWPAIHAMGIRAVLSLQDEYEDVFEGTPPERTLRLPVVDHHAPTMEQLEEGVQFLAKTHEDNLPVLVHCHAGMGRAPTAASAYLMRYHGKTAKEAMMFLYTRRPIVGLNEEQWQRLYEWQRHIRSEA